jgi:hypothetical protein
VFPSYSEERLKNLDVTKEDSRVDIVVSSDALVLAACCRTGKFQAGHGLKQVPHLLIVHGFCVVQAVPTAKGQALADEFGIQFFETVRR